MRWGGTSQKKGGIFTRIEVKLLSSFPFSPCCQIHQTLALLSFVHLAATEMESVRFTTFFCLNSSLILKFTAETDHYQILELC
jgi:hypothetical protein